MYIPHLILFVKYKFQFSFWNCKYQFRFQNFNFELYLHIGKSIFIFQLVHIQISIYISIIICTYIYIFICRYIYIIMHINDVDINTHDIDRYIYKQHAALCLYIETLLSCAYHNLYQHQSQHHSHFFHMNIHILITFSHRRFVYIHTFFCSKIMCGCRLLTYLYDIQYISYECRLHYSHIAPPAPIEAKFCTHPQARYAPQPIRAATPVLSYPVCLYNAAAIIYKHILRGKIRLT